jgi:DNA polymerase type B, organellar and viral
VKVGIRDTFLLAPSTAKSLDALGQLIGSHKLSLSDEELKRMDVLRREDLQRFVDYAQMDSRIALEFSERIADLATSFGKERYIPTTLTGLGVVFLKQLWKDNGFDEFKILGKEKVTQTFQDRSTGKLRKRSVRVSNTQRHLYAPLATECYHGGRNEQYFFGAGVVGTWTDYDLPNAYPTGMSQLGTPKWNELRLSSDVEELSRHRLSYAQVEFKHPEGIRFPVLPVRGDNSVLFPMEGTSFCCGPELLLARSLGVEMKVLLGVIIPEEEDKPFGKYLKHCFEKRDEAKKQGNEVLNQLWKELANSMYGKLAQGLRRRTVYSIKKGESEDLPECSITTPFYAAFTTSFCRAVLGEILNKLPRSVSVCSCTTDGFLSNASEEQIREATSGVLSRQYLQAHRYFNPEKVFILESKSVIQQPMGWRTRGQATLLPTELPEKFVLAKAGLKPEGQDKADYNRWIIEKFPRRVFGEKYPVKSFVSVRDMFEEQSDLYSILSLITVSMDFDWKRRVDHGSLSLRQICSMDHVFFDTFPWKTAQESEDCKNHWKEFSQTNGVCLKTIEDVQNFQSFLECQKVMLKRPGRNNPKKGNVPMKMFRGWFARAYVNGAYGLPSSDTHRHSYRFLEKFFAERGLEGMRAALSNSRHNPVDPPNMIPSSPDVVRLVVDLKRLIPSFDETKVFSTPHKIIKTE